MIRKIIFTAFILIGNIAMHSQENTSDSFSNALIRAKDDSEKIAFFREAYYSTVYSAPEKAIAYAREALLLTKEKGYSREFETIVVSAYGYALGIVGNFPEAIKYLLQSEESVREIKTGNWGYGIYNNIVETYRDEADFVNAKFYLDKWWEFFLEKQRANAQTSSYEERLATNQIYFVTKAQVEEKLNNLDSALWSAQKAIELEQKFDIFKFDVIPLIIGDVYRKKRDYSKAFDYYRNAEALALRKNTIKDLMDIYNGMAKIFMILHQSDSCVYYANKTILLRQSYAYKIAELDALNILSALYKSQNKMDSAVKYLELTTAVKDSLFSQAKEREVQSLSFDKKLEDQERQQSLKQAQVKYRNRLFYYILIGGLVILFIVIAGLWRRNVFKQKSLSLVRQQKAEIETTLSQLKSTQAQLIQSEKMASLGELTAGIAHEIQNPLNFVNNFSDVNAELLDELSQEADKGNIEEVKSIAKGLKENEQKINHHGKRADAIVRGMLQHTRTSSGQKEATDINALCDEYVRLAYHGIRAKDKSFNAEIQTDLDPSIGKINIVPQDIGRVILNLLNNAFYAVGERQKVEGLGYDPTVIVMTRKVNSKIEIHVKDNGKGIPENIVEKIFQPFFTTKPAGQGTGLGLSLAYDIVKAHGGEIKVEAEEGKGSEFIVQLFIV